MVKADDEVRGKHEGHVAQKGACKGGAFYLILTTDVSIGKSAILSGARQAGNVTVKVVLVTFWL